MKTDLLRVSVRQNAIYIPTEATATSAGRVTDDALEFVGNVKKLGYTVSEELLHALGAIAPDTRQSIFDLLKELTGAGLNWTPLVRGWNVPTGESRLDHVITFFANLAGKWRGVRLPCGHLIPENTFPLERYNGCPYCGTPFRTGETEVYGQGSKLKVLTLWTDDDLNGYFRDLLECRTPLDATAMDSLKILLRQCPLPVAEIRMKETRMAVIDALVEKGTPDAALPYFSAPNDVLRYLWYKKTGLLQIIPPRTIVRRTVSNNRHLSPSQDRARSARTAQKEALKLKYTRTECRMVAGWLNALDMDVRQACETMHPRRGMWVRFIRALRLAEYARRPGFGKLKELMDVFYNEDYEVWQGRVDHCRLKADAAGAFALLKQRPGLFARSLFATMLWYGAGETLAAFAEVADKLPARLVFTLNMYARTYFDLRAVRTVRVPAGATREIPANRYLRNFTEEERAAMIDSVEEFCLQLIARRFAAVPTESTTMYIDPALFGIPLLIGDRSETVQDTSCALAGMRFPVEGNAVRLFMQWGRGLPAQHLDMDLSCYIAYPEGSEVCAYYQLVATGATHSGDIRSIPHEVGTAEYVELDLDCLTAAGACYVAFVCNAYSAGALSPNLSVGWMSSAHPMKISERTGVAYDPSCVQHQVRVTQSLSKGLVFGVLDVASREIIWLEMPFAGQVVANMNAETLEGVLGRLRCKTTIGNLLSVKAVAQNIRLTEDAGADEVYTVEWAMNTAGVTKLLID